MNRRLFLAACAATLIPAGMTAAFAQTHGGSGHGGSGHGGAGHGGAGHGSSAQAPASTATFRIGALVIEAPWTRATPGGAKVAGGFMTIRNTGTTPDRLVGGTFPGAPRVEVHEMAMADGMMRMRELRGGLDIPAGGSVQLRPGGYHMMFMDLSEPIRTGTALKGTLVFEKAGTIEIAYDVAPVGAPGPAGAMRH
jgi:copper(I)-binding protein